LKKLAITFLVTILIIIFFNYKNLFKYFLVKEINKITKLDASFEIEKLNIIDGKFIFKDISLSNIKNKDEIFKIPAVEINFSVNSIFSDNVIFYDVNIFNPEFFFKIRENKEKITDNLNLIEKISNNKEPEIYPVKKRDKNFIIYKLNFNNAIARLKYPLSNNVYLANLSDMSFNNIGNANTKKTQHYKDVFDLILKDLYFRITDQNLKEFISQNYLNK
jgi:hypothetical protein